eukprot:gene12221-3597_t
MCDFSSESSTGTHTRSPSISDLNGLILEIDGFWFDY